MRRVAIVGRCYSTRADAPWNDPAWEIWALAWDPLPVVHRIFEVHQNFRMFLGSQKEGDHHVGGLRMAKVPVYMLDHQPDIKMSVRYPIEEITQLVGKTNNGHPYLESSIAYMVALAVLEMNQGDKLAIFGVDMHCESEYAFQRPNMEYLIGLARGRGVKVLIPPQCALLSSQMGVPYGFYSSTDVGAPQTPLPKSQAA